jgi:hypothetical protein
MKVFAAAALEVGARPTAQQIAEWIRPWQPQVLWVLPEMAAVGVATHLRAMLGIPVHLTLHDVFESAGFDQLPGWYMGRYAGQAVRLARDADSMDGISEELIGRVAKDGMRGRTLPAVKTMVFPPSISRAAIANEPVRDRDETCFRLALCGSMRTGKEQWLRFIKGLTAVYKHVEIVAVGDALVQAKMARLQGVRMVHHSYFQKEEALVAYLRESRVDAGYAGVWDEPDRRLFAATSFSSKITAYAAAGVPTIFDGPGESAAWKVLARWHAGVLWRDTQEGLLELKGLKDCLRWSAMAEGALSLGRQELCLEDNAGRFRAMLVPGGQGSDVGCGM